jgi:hypothetical protein
MVDSVRSLCRGAYKSRSSAKSGSKTDAEGLGLRRLTTMMDLHGYELLGSSINDKICHRDGYRQIQTIVIRTNVQAASLAACNFLLDTEYTRSEGRHAFLIENLGCIQSRTGCQNLNAVSASRNSYSLSGILGHIDVRVLKFFVGCKLQMGRFELEHVLE